MMTSSYARRLRAEQLEDRRMLAAVAVGNNLDVVNGDTASIASLIASDGGDGISLREAISAANNTAGTDTITFDSSVFTGGSSSVIRLGGSELVITEALTIDASAGTGVVITGDSAGNDTLVSGTFITDVDASLAADSTSLDDNSRILKFTAGSGDLTLRRLTITGGRTTSSLDAGGGIDFAGSGVLTIDRSTVSGNSAGGGSASGGGIYAYDGDVTLTRSTVSGNSAGGGAGSGGGIYTYYGDITLASSTVSGNSSGNDGGGIHTVNGKVTLTSSTVSGNSSGDDGGGIHIERDGNVTLTGSTVSGNSSGDDGGGIFSAYGAVTLANSTVSGNSSSGHGGGIYTDDSTVRVLNSTITNNTAVGRGGGIGLFADNYTDDERLTVRNSIVALNTDSGTAPDLLAPGDPANDLSVDYSLIGNTTGSGVTAATGAGNVLNVDPMLGPLSDNGGPTLTRALLAGSPAINAGDPAFAGPPNSDQRGTGFARVSGSQIDIGAFERRPEQPSLVVTTAADTVDDFDFVTSLREAINFANSQAGADTITFDSSVFTGGSSSVIRLSGSELVVSEALTIDGTTGTGVVITADSAGNDTLVSGTFITDVDASLAADLTSLDDNSRVLNFTAASGDLTLRGLAITGGRGANLFETGSGVRFVSSGVLELDQSNVSGNTSADGGGIYSNTGAVTLTGSTVSGNSSVFDGGGIFSRSGAVTLMSSTISGNNSGGRGGGIFTSTGAVMLTASATTRNSSNSDGGGVYSASGAVTLTNSTVSGNGSLNEGGGIYTNDSTVRIQNSTVASNTAGGVGGGIGLFADDFNDDEQLIIRNSIVALNTDNGTAPDILAPGDPANDLSVDYSLIGDTTGSGVTGSTGTGNLLNRNPLIGALADNGGPTQTRALLVGSPAINRGDPSFVGPPNFDQRGASFARVSGGQIDMGAFEVSAPASLIVSTAVDEFDNDFSSGDFSLREAIFWANSTSGADTITFDSSVFTGGAASLIRLSGSELFVGGPLTIDGSTGTDVVITGDSANNDTLVSGTFITDVDASLAADSTSLDDNSRVFNTGGDVTLHGLTITGGRTVLGFGGGGVLAGSGSLKVTNSIVSGNSSTVGGGIYVDFFASLTVTGSTVNDNRSVGPGGGIVSQRTAVTLNNSTVSGNRGSSGGGIYSIGTVRIENSTVASNTAGGTGGGILLAAAFNAEQQQLIVRNSIVALNNDNGTAPDLRAPGAPGDDLSVDYSLIGNTTGSGVTGSTGTGNLLDVNPLIDSLSDNGGATQTHALLPGSPAINAGDPSFSGPPDFDQRGASFARVRGGRIDMGALEVQTAPPQGLVVSTNSDVVDGDFSVGQFSLREAIIVANSTAGADTITFDSSVFTGGAASLIRLGGTELPVNEALTIDGSTGTGVVITADSANNDTLVSGTFITDVDASLAADSTSLDDNSRVLSFTASTGVLTLNSLTVTGGRITGTAEDGAGIRSTLSGAVTLNSTAVSGNSSGGEGGGVFALNGAVTLNSSTISGNVAVRGGGITAGTGAVMLNNSTVSGNSAVSGINDPGQGGGIFSVYGAVSLNNSTVTANSSGGNGGGVYVPNIPANPPLTIQNSIVAGNTAAGSGPDLRPDPNSTLDIDYSLIGDTNGTVVSGSTGTGNLLNVNPLLDVLADNGGPTRTHALQPGSQAINAGDPSFAGPPGFDQRGASFARVQGGRIDIGAFEVQTATLPSQGLVVSTTTDVVDSDFSVGQLSLREAIGIANDLAGADTITFDSSVFTGGAASLIRLSGTELLVSEALTIDGSTGTDVVITGDSANNDTLVGGTFLTDVDASLAADSTSLDDNSRVLNTNVDLTLRGLTITGGRFLDSVVGGGGIFSRTGLLTVTNSTVSGNSANYGGGIFVDGFASLTVTGSTVSENRSAGVGGGIVTSGNASAGNTLTLNNSTVSGNRGSSGGGIFSFARTVRVENSTVTSNTAGGTGGGILLGDALTQQQLIVRNSIVALNNDNGTAPDLFAPGAPVDDLSVDYSLISNTTGSGVTGSTGTGNLLNVNPLIGALADNGGPTLTQAPLAGSPALDSGDPAVVFSASESDQRGAGFFRVGDGGVAGLRIDMGAHEVQTAAPALPGDYNRDFFVDAADYTVWRDALNASVPAFSGADGNGDAQITQADYQIWRDNFGATLTSPPVFGVSDVFLNGLAAGTFTADDPDGSHTQETNLGNLTADANLAEAQKFDSSVVISVKNGGGIRASIGRIVAPGGGGTQQRLPNEVLTNGAGAVVRPAGGVTQSDIQSALPFNNGLVLLDVTRADLVALLEDGVAAAPSANTDFPQVAGIKFSFDQTRAVGDRVISAGVFDGNDDLITELVRDGATVGDPNEVFRVVTIDFLANGGDPVLSNLSNPNRIDLQDLNADGANDGAMTGAGTFADDGSEQDALAEYLNDNFNPASGGVAFAQTDTGPLLDDRIQNLAFRQDTVLPDPTPALVVLAAPVQESLAGSPTPEPSGASVFTAPTPAGVAGRDAVFALLSLPDADVEDSVATAADGAEPDAAFKDEEQLLLVTASRAAANAGSEASRYETQDEAFADEEEEAGQGRRDGSRRAPGLRARWGLRAGDA